MGLVQVRRFVEMAVSSRGPAVWDDLARKIGRKVDEATLASLCGQSRAIDPLTEAALDSQGKWTQRQDFPGFLPIL